MYPAEYIPGSRGDRRTARRNNAAAKLAAVAIAMGGAVIPIRKAEVTEPTAIKQARAVRAVMETLDERELDAVRRVMDALRVGEAQA